jgi:predicted TIM-barrel fold metal-dependent hydrolase
MEKISYKDFDIIDVHAHIIENISGFGYRGELRAIGNGKARWVTGEEADILVDAFGSKSFTHDRLIKEMDTHGVSKAILLQGSFLGYCNEYVHEAQEKYPGRLFGMGTFDPYCLDYIRIMKRLINDFKLRGFKFEMSTEYGFMGYHPDFKIDGDRMRPVWEYAGEEKLIISLDLGTFGEKSLQIKELAGIAHQYPGIRFVVEHLFYPHLDHFDDVKTSLEILANQENIYFTTASIPNSTMPEKYPYPSACRYLEIAKEVVGAKRLMWGSDIPGVVVNASYDDLINYVAESGIFNHEELQDVYAGNAIRIYRL